MAKLSRLGVVLFFCVSGGLVSPAMGKMSGTRLTIGVQVVEPCTISTGHGGPASVGGRSTVACARDRVASLRTIHGAAPAASMTNVSTRSENNPTSLADPYYEIAEIAF